MYADIIVDISHEKVDKPFSYKIPEKMEDDIKPGAVVRIPFGRGNKQLRGYVTGFSEQCDYDDSKIKEIISIDERDVSIEAVMLELALWMKDQYGGTLSQSLAAVLPVKRRVKKRTAENTENSTGDTDTELPALTHEQSVALERFISDYSSGLRNEYLLFGVTGSGKTRVYIEMMRTTLSEGKSVIVLIPEIALTAQNIKRFTKAFGDKISVLHSRLSDGERYETYEKAKNGEIKIVLGPRSALFAPFCDLGLIIVDEEHETSYKSEQVPKYDAKEVARKRAALSNAALVLGSATPEISTMKRAIEGKSTLLELKSRIDNRPLPKARIVDMRLELKKGNRTMFSDELNEAMDAQLKKGNQIMLFLNRRGINSFVSCRSCGLVLKCPHCDVSLHQHNDGFLKCHYCGYKTKQPDVCPECGSRYIGGFKAGTQSVEKALKKMYPAARVLRMDADTTSKKGSHERILKAFETGNADILIGTQMIVKGHDFKGVTLVGILAADLSLNASDYTAEERTYALLTQASGRAGRGALKGEVIIQTYRPDDYAIIAAASCDYEGFYKRELSYRALMHYPPEGHMLLIQISDLKEEKAKSTAFEIEKIIKASKLKLKMSKVNEALISRLKDRYRYAIYIKSDERSRLVELKNYLENGFEFDARVQFDFDPIGTY